MRCARGGQRDAAGLTGLLLPVEHTGRTARAAWMRARSPLQRLRGGARDEEVTPDLGFNGIIWLGFQRRQRTLKMQWHQGIQHSQAFGEFKQVH